MHFLSVSGCSAEWSDTDYYFFKLWFSSLGCMREGTWDGMTQKDGQFCFMPVVESWPKRGDLNLIDTLPSLASRRLFAFPFILEWFESWIQILLNIQKYVCFILRKIFSHMFRCRTSANISVLLLDNVDEDLVFDS